MPTPINADTRYDDTHTWQNANDRVSAERVMLRTPAEERLMAIAKATAEPSMPEEMIRENMTIQDVPPRYGYEDQRADPPGIDYMFRLPGTPPPSDAKPTDFSGTNTEMQSSSLPGMPIW